MTWLLQRALPWLYGFLLILVGWQLAVTAFDIPSYVLPTPAAVLQALVVRRDELLGNTLVTAQETLLGFGVAIVVGVGAATLIAFSRVAAAVVYPLLISSQVIPKVALVPLFVIWFGFGTLSKVLVAFLISFFPIAVNTATGLVGVDRQLIYLSLSMGGGRLKTLLKVRLPSALPYFFSGLKVGVTLAVVGAVVGEFVGADRGLGYILLGATSRLDTALAFASILLMSALGMILYAAVEILERFTIPWHVSTEPEGRYIRESL